jgi:acyl-CoA thioesterase-1
MALCAGLAMMLAAMAMAAPVPKATLAPSPARTVLVLGDSLSAGYGLAASEGWVALLAKRMATSHPGWKVVNASISGETTAGGATRIAAELQRHRPAVVVVELGANDGLRGLPLVQTRANLESIIRRSQAAGRAGRRWRRVRPRPLPGDAVAARRRCGSRRRRWSRR